MTKTKYSAALISLGSTSSKWTLEEMKKVFRTVDHLNLKEIEVSFSGDKQEVLHKGERIKQYDCIFAKGSFRYAQLLESVTAILENGCFMPVKSSAFSIGHDKLLTQLSLQQAGIPMPKTYIVSTVDATKTLLEKINFPIILKFPHGTGGKGVIYADSIVVAQGILDALSALNQPFIIQEFIETGGKDVRAIVIGDKVVAAYQRVANNKDIRANIHSGGHGEPIELDSSTRKLCIKASQSVGCEIAGVDLLFSHRGPLVLEVNLSPGLQGVTNTTKVNVAEKIAGYLAERTKERKEKISKHNSKEIMKELTQEEPEQEIITPLEFRGNKILLPEIITKLTRFNENADYLFKTGKEKLEITRFHIK